MKKIIKYCIYLVVTIVIVGCLFLWFATKTGFGPGYGDGLYYKEHFAEIKSQMIKRAIIELFTDLECYDLSELYDKDGKKFEFKRNDQESVKKIIIALQDPIYYKSNPFGPYLPKNDEDKSDYENFVPESNKNFGGYRIEIWKDSQDVECIPVTNKSEAVIVVH